jgi:predicted RND superfamily exporter protein
MGRPYATVAFVGLITAASFLAALDIPTNFSYGEVTAGDLPVVTTLDSVSATMSGSIDRAYLFVEGPVDEPEVFLAMAAVAREAAGDSFVVDVGGAPAVAWIGSIAQREVAMAALAGSSGGDPISQAFHSLDSTGNGHLAADDNLTRAGLASLYQALLDARGNGASQFVSRSSAGFDRAAMVVDIRNAVSNADEIRAALEADATPLRAQSSVSRVTVTGPQLLNQEVMAAVQTSGWQSVMLTVALSVVLLAVFFALSFRAPLLGALCVVPSLVAVGWTFGLMALFGLTLNMMTVMIATSTVGIGDLYAIHAAHSHLKGIRAGKGPDAAAMGMATDAAVPLLEAAATTALGFLVLVASPIPAVRAYGAIFAVSIVFAFVFSIVLMPIFVRALARLSRAPAPGEQNREGHGGRAG